MNTTTIDFAMHLTGHDRLTIEQMYKDWNGNRPLDLVDLEKTYKEVSGKNAKELRSDGVHVTLIECYSDEFVEYLKNQLIQVLEGKE